MNKYIKYEDIQEFLRKIIEAPIVEDPDYLLGVNDGKIIRISEW